jgi:hypothetical protein
MQRKAGHIILLYLMVVPAAALPIRFGWMVGLEATRLPVFSVSLYLGFSELNRAIRGHPEGCYAPPSFGQES